MASSSTGSLPVPSSQFPYSRFDALGTTAERCDELRRMSDDHIAMASCKTRKATGNVAVQRNVDVPDEHLMEYPPFGNWWKARYSKASIRLLQFDMVNNLTFILGMPFIVSMLCSV